MRSSDLVAQAVGGIVARPVRAVLTSVGTVLGVGALVAIVGLSSTVRAQISDEFDALRAVEVRVHPTDAMGAEPLPSDTDNRVAKLAGVVSGGLMRPIADTEYSLRAAAELPLVDVALYGMSPGGLGAVGPRPAGAQWFSPMVDPHPHVALVGRVAAEKLNVSSAVDHSILVSGRPFLVVGTIDEAARLPDLLNAVVIPAAVAELYWPVQPGTQGEVLIETVPGGAQQVARQVALALRPQGPEVLAVTAPPDSQNLRREVEGDVQALLLVLAAVCLCIGAVSIANTTFVAVLERTEEIGLRRALGARRLDIGLQFLLETTGLGLAGGLVGSSLGLIVTTVLAAINSWVTVVPIVPILASPLLGGAVGLAAGVLPALRAARTTPVAALRR